ncbi:hypothetical protein AX660_08305 [Paraglaciecola hydrolytica]|uniref:Uncharacterized protein n=1 Tax=Paraglaciecola hydrolytica TaxID=1799789 RepID=A0A136A437_9ALTE|nr:hypothetical protein AX660_08305 [Paraglaciecola hydrolytica]
MLAGLVGDSPLRWDGIIGSLAVDCRDAGGRAKQDARAECYSHMGVSEVVLGTQPERTTRMDARLEAATGKYDTQMIYENLYCITLYGYGSPLGFALRGSA